MRIRIFRRARRAKSSRRCCRSYCHRGATLRWYSFLKIHSRRFECLRRQRCSRLGKRLREGRATSLPRRPIRRGRPEPAQRTHRGLRAPRRRMRSPQQDPRCSRQSQPDGDARRGRPSRRCLPCRRIRVRQSGRWRGRCRRSCCCWNFCGESLGTTNHADTSAQERARRCRAPTTPVASVSWVGAFAFGRG